MNLKIAAFYSFQSEIIEEFKKDVYIKVFCGSKDGISDEFLNKMDFFDSDGENISELNDLVNEMTGIYWLYKNYDKIGNPDFIGTAHYRRYIKFQESDIQENNIICFNMSQPFNVFNTYSFYHVKDDLKLFNREFSIAYQNYATDLNNFMNNTKHVVRNIFIMSRQNFMQYGNFIEQCLQICKKISVNLNLSNRDKYQKRALSFIMERMTGFWIYQKSVNDSNIKIVNRDIIQKDVSSPYQR